MEKQLNHFFEFSEFRAGQKDVIETLLLHKSCAAIFPTGSGKSLCYQFTAQLMENLTVVVSPLLALMKDQVDFLTSKGIKAVVIDSTQSVEERFFAMKAIKSGEVKILFISVERFKNERFRTFLATLKLSLLVIDEAHCISEWGHNFRPDYLKLPFYQQQFGFETVLLLTATATEKVILDMQKAFSIAPECVIKTGFHRDNLRLSVKAVSDSDKLKTLKNTVSEFKKKSCIIYVTRQNTAETVAQYLCLQGIEATSFHAGMKDNEKVAIQNDFMQSKITCIVATIAFGMGIDKSDIRHIIHYDLPKSIENYAQEIGRAGRDGKPSNCVVYGSLTGIPSLENFIYGDNIEQATILVLLKAIKACDKTFEFSYFALSMQYNIKLLPLKTLITYLEIFGIIEAAYSYFSEYRFKFIQTQSEILANFSGERLNFVKLLFEHSKKAKLWLTVDLETLVEVCDFKRERITSALEFFHEKQWIELEAKQTMDVYHICDRQFNVVSTAEKLFRKFEEKADNGIEKLQEMVAYFQSHCCLSKGLAAYFGEQLEENCGQCSVCQGAVELWLEQKVDVTISSSIIENAIVNLERAILEKISKTGKLDVTMVCNFLCGISMPWFVKMQVKKMPHWAIYETVPYKGVKKAVTDILGV